MKTALVLTVFLILSFPVWAQNASAPKTDSVLNGEPPGKDHNQIELTNRHKGSTLWFNGVDHVVTIGRFMPLTVNTFEGWIKPTSKKKMVVLANGGGPREACAQGIIVEASKEIVCYDVNPAGCGNENPVCYPFDRTSKWIHFAGTYDGNTSKLYINGELKHALSNLSFDSSDWLTLGGILYYNGFQSFFAGQMDEMRVWNVVRSQEEIRKAMHESLTGKEEGLIAYWRFDEDKGQHVTDLTGNNFNGVLGTDQAIQSSDPLWAPLDASFVSSPTFKSKSQTILY